MSTNQAILQSLEPPKKETSNNRCVLFWSARWTMGFIQLPNCDINNFLSRVLCCPEWIVICQDFDRFMCIKWRSRFTVRGIQLHTLRKNTCCMTLSQTNLNVWPIGISEEICRPAFVRKNIEIHRGLRGWIRPARCSNDWLAKATYLSLSCTFYIRQLLLRFHLIFFPISGHPGCTWATRSAPEKEV